MKSVNGFMLPENAHFHDISYIILVTLCTISAYIKSCNTDITLR